MGDRFINVLHDLHRQNVIEEFGVKIIRSRRRTVDDLRRFFIQP